MKGVFVFTLNRQCQSENEISLYQLRCTNSTKSSSDGINPECMTDDETTCFSGTTRSACQQHITDNLGVIPVQCGD